MPVDLIVTPPPAIILRVQQLPRIVIRVGSGVGGGGGAGTITEIQNAGGLIVTAGTGPIVQVAADFGSAAGKVTQGNDARLSDARTPTAHKTTHATGGTDALAPSDIGAVPTARLVATGTGLLGGGDLSADRTLTPDFGSGVGKITQGNDSRLSDARTPTGAAGGDLSGTYPNPVVVAPSDPWLFFHKAPASPNTDDDEFTGGSLNARWTAVKQGTWTAATIAGTVSRAGPAAGAVNLTPNYRGTHLAWQGADGGIIRTFTMPAVLQIRFRVAANGNSASGTSGPFASLYCGGYSGGAPDMATNYVRHGWTNNQPTANTKIWLTTGRSSGGGGFDTTGPNMWGMTDDIEFIMVIQAGAGTSTCSWFVRSGPSSHFLKSQVINGIGVGGTSYIYLRFINISASGDPSGGAQSALGLCDYIRIRTDGDIEAY